KAVPRSVGPVQHGRRERQVVFLRRRNCMNHRTTNRAVKWAGLGLVACASLFVQSARAADSDFPDGAGKHELLRACTVCHNSDRIHSAKKSREQWVTTVNRMQNKGVDATADEIDLIVEYLVASFSPNNKVNVNKAEPTDFVTLLALTAKDAQAIVDY